jgi:hypothetical protein
MGEPSALKVPTRPIAVRLALLGQEPEPAELFFGGKIPDSRSQLAQEVAEMLENGAAFVPMATGGSVSLCNKSAIAWVALATVGAGSAGFGGGVDGVPEPMENAEPSEVVTLYDHRHEVHVEFASNAALEGHVLYSSPEGRDRVIDHLNRPTRYLWLWQGTTLYLINKQHVVRVIERGR